MGRVVHFEIGADDPERAAKFYEQALGWKVTKASPEYGDYWMVDTGEGLGIGGGMYKRQGESAKSHDANAFVCTVDVEDVEDAMKKVKAAGGKLVGEKLDIPQIGTFHSCEDTEGNHFSILQALPNMGMTSNPQ